MGSSAVSQALLLAASPLLTRLYSPADFGLFGAYAAIATIVIVIAGLRFEAAIPLPADDEEAFHLLLLAVGCGVATSAALAVAVLFLRHEAAAALDLPALERWLWLLPLTVATGTAYQACTYWHIRKANFSTVARTNVAQSSSTISTQTTLGGVAPGPAGLFLGDLAAKVVGSAALGRLALRDGSRWLLQVRPRSLVATAGRHRRFPLIASFSSLANIAAIYIPAPLFAAFYGPSQAGAMVLAQRTVSLPASMLAAAAGQVFLGQAARAAQSDPASTLSFYRFAVPRLAACAVAFTVVGALVLPNVFAPVFGERWTEAGEFSRVLCISAGVGLVVSPISQIVFIAGRQGIQLVGDLGRLVVVAGAMFAAYKGWPDDPSAGVIAYAAAMTITYGAFLGFYYSCALQIGRRAA
jgi:O-antigen/teichoic acid export membrane protein